MILHWGHGLRIFPTDLRRIDKSFASKSLSVKEYQHIFVKVVTFELSETDHFFHYLFMNVMKISTHSETIHIDSSNAYFVSEFAWITQT